MIFKVFLWSEKWSEVKSLSHVQLFATSWTVACQAPPSIGFSRLEYWSGLPFPSPGDLPNPGKRKSCNSGVPLPHPLQSLPTPTPTPHNPSLYAGSQLPGPGKTPFKLWSAQVSFPHDTFPPPAGHPSQPQHEMQDVPSRERMSSNGSPLDVTTSLSHSCSSVICMGIKASSTGVGLTLDQDLESGQASE